MRVSPKLVTLTKNRYGKNSFKNRRKLLNYFLNYSGRGLTGTARMLNMPSSVLLRSASYHLVPYVYRPRSNIRALPIRSLGYNTEDELFLKNAHKADAQLARKLGVSWEVYACRYSEFIQKLMYMRVLNYDE